MKHFLFTSMNGPEALYTIDEVCLAFGRKRVQVWRWMKAGLLIPSCADGRRPLFSMEDLKEFIERKNNKNEKDETSPGKATYDRSRNGEIAC